MMSLGWGQTGKDLCTKLDASETLVCQNSEQTILRRNIGKICTENG